MKVLSEYRIPFAGLKEGSHDFHFEADEAFFSSFEYSEIEQGRIRVDVSMVKQSRMLIFDTRIKGQVTIPCDRCLGTMDYPVEGSERLFVKFGAEHKEESEDVMIIPEKESHFDLSPFIYEYIVLLLPYQRVHADENECDQEMILKLNDHSEAENDPRWDALRHLKNKFE